MENAEGLRVMKEELKDLIPEEVSRICLLFESSNVPYYKSLEKLSYLVYLFRNIDQAEYSTFFSIADSRVGRGLPSLPIRRRRD